jgi:hypothetical protein
MVEPVRAEQIPQEQAIFNEAWRIMKKYYSLCQNSTDKEWEALTDEAEALSKMRTGAANERLGKDLALAVLTHIETVSKERI